jgi:hypothetical protein
MKVTTRLNSSQINLSKLTHLLMTNRVFHYEGNLQMFGLLTSPQDRAWDCSQSFKTQERKVPTPVGMNYVTFDLSSSHCSLFYVQIHRL